MCGLYIVSLFFVALFGTKVNGYFNDGINPVKETLSVWSHQRTARVAYRNNVNIYECEDVPDSAPPESNRTCNFRNVDYQEQVFKWLAGRGCLLYTPDFLYENGTNTINLNAACFYGEHYAPCLEITKQDGTVGCYPFDPGLEEVVLAVKNALVPSAHGRWERCFEEAARCCNQYMADVHQKELYSDDEDELKPCPATFDGWTCWQPALGDTVANEVCSEFAYSNMGPSCHHFSNKQCYHNGTWEIQTDYSTCSITSRLLRRYRFYIAMLAFSIASCLPAVFIFFFYKRLRVTRVALHRNLLIAIIIRNIFVIISRSEIYIDELTNTGDTIMSTHTIACRILAICERIAANAVFVCMLVEGVYLHRLIVAVFRKKLNIMWLYVVGAVIAIVPVIAWSIVMGVHNDHSCWLVYTVDNIQWIIDAPRLAILLINTVLFVDVLRVLLTKIRNSENANQLSTTKATLFLMPVFGSQFLLTAFRPGTTNCVSEQAYYYVTYTVEGLQGFIVALLYCYVNKEVRMLIKATYKKTEDAVVSRVRGDNYSRQGPSEPNSRRLTYSTNIPSQYGDELKDQYKDATRLHVAEIISIQASERLAEILDPIYETIENGVTNEAYDSLERPVYNNRGRPEDFYGFTTASSISIENQDWIKCVSSPEGSVYNTSQYELDKRIANTHKLGEINEIQDCISDEYETDISNPQTFNAGRDLEADRRGELDPDDDDDSMLEEILQYIEETNETNINLDPDLLSPNRSKDDKIVFVDQ